MISFLNSSILDKALGRFSINSNGKLNIVINWYVLYRRLNH